MSAWHSYKYSDLLESEGVEWILLSNPTMARAFLSNSATCSLIFCNQRFYSGVIQKQVYELPLGAQHHDQAEDWYLPSLADPCVSRLRASLHWVWLYLVSWSSLIPLIKHCDQICHKSLTHYPCFLTSYWKSGRETDSEEIFLLETYGGSESWFYLIFLLYYGSM